MALDDVQHVEVVALLNALLENPITVIPVPLREGVEGWVKENHPPPRAYMSAMGSMAGQPPKPMPVSGMAALRDPDSIGVLLTLTTGVEQDARDWPFRLGSTDADALGCALRSLRRRGGKDTDEMRVERDSLTQALAILEPKADGMPACPVCGAEAVRGEAQQVTRIKAGMEAQRVEAGVHVYVCANDHYHDGEQETGPLPQDITIREGF